MPNTVLGKVSITPKGNFSLGTPYNRLDLVYSDYTAYLSKTENIGVELTDVSVWMKIVEGMPGKSAYESAVDAGYTGTEEEFIQDLINFEDYADRAERAAANAEQSEQNAKISEENAASSETAAKESEETARSEADRAKAEADRAAGASGFNPDDFATAAQGQKADTALQGIQIDGVEQEKTDGVVNLTTEALGLDDKVSKSGDTMTGPLTIHPEGKPEIKINVESSDAASITAYNQSGAYGKLNIYASALNFPNAIKITHLSTPTNDYDAANKKYVDSRGKRTCRFVVGTSTAGWTAADCDYLCDGTDDQVEIQAAINALPSTGGEVVVLDGTYNITEKINASKENLKLKGCGKSTQLKRMANSKGDLYGLINITNNGIQVSNFFIYGNSQNFTDSYNCGITISNKNGDILISDNYFQDHKNFILCMKKGFIRSRIVNNMFYDTDSDGILLEGNNQEIVINGNSFLYCGNSGINLYHCQASSVFGNTFWRNGYGIKLSYNAKNNTISGNSFLENTYRGISCDITQNLDFIEGNTICGNVCFNNKDGIYLKGCNKNLIVGNTCIRGTGLPSDYTSTQYTIYLEGTNNNYNLITNNNIMGKNYVSGGGTGNTFVNNKYN